MGTVKPRYIKRLGQQLLRDVQAFTDDFELNKKLVTENTNIESKGIRNRVAGYITHKKKRTQEEAEEVEELVVEAAAEVEETKEAEEVEAASEVEETKEVEEVEEEGKGGGS